MKARKWPLLLCAVAVEGGPWWESMQGGDDATQDDSSVSWQSPTVTPLTWQSDGTPTWESPTLPPFHPIPTLSSLPTVASATPVPMLPPLSSLLNSNGSNMDGANSSHWWTQGFFKDRRQRRRERWAKKLGLKKSSSSSSSTVPPPPPTPATPVLTTAVSTTTTPPGTCKDFTCDNFLRGRSCQCNLDCWRWNDCCSDFQPRCLQLGREHLPDLTMEFPCFFNNTAYKTAKTVNAPTAVACQAICAEDRWCQHFTWSTDQNCSMAMIGSEIAVNHTGMVSGPAKCAIETRAPVILKSLSLTTTTSTTMAFLMSSPALPATPTTPIPWIDPAIVPFSEDSDYDNSYDSDDEDGEASIEEEEKVNDIMNSLSIPDCAGGGMMYLPDIPGHPPQLVKGPMACQFLCTQIPECAHFSFTYGGWCHFAAGSGLPTPTGIEDDVAGPSVCAKEAGGQTTGLYAVAPAVLKAMGSSTTYALFGALAAMSGLFWGARVLFSGHRCDEPGQLLDVVGGSSSAKGDEGGFFSRSRLSRSLLSGSSSRHVTFQVFSEYQALSVEDSEC